jgi:Sulfotransferase family
MKRRKKQLHCSVAPLLCLCGVGIALFALVESLFTVILIRRESSEVWKNDRNGKIIRKQYHNRLTLSVDLTNVGSPKVQDKLLKEIKRRKVYPTQANSTHYHTMQNPYGGAFVHTGKTAGSTLSVLLRNGCHSFMPHPCRYNITNESIVSKLVESYYHVPDFATLKQSNHTFYIITCRDPFDRTISAFVYDHIRNKYARNETISAVKELKYEEAYKCFPTLQRYVEFLGDHPNQFHYPHKQNWVTASSCSDLAKAAFHSRVKIYNHLFFSMRLLLSFIPKLEKQSLYAIRQEHLWSDWKTVNKILGQDEPIYIPAEETNRIRNVASLEEANQMPVTRELNAFGINVLCNALHEEYQKYFFLLKRSKNLSSGDLQQSIDRAKQNCPALDIGSIVDSV